MIKKALLGLGIGMLALVGVSYGANYEQEIPIGIEKFASHMNSTYDIGVLPKGRFITNRAGYSRNIFGMDNQSFIFWDLAGNLYYYGNIGSVWQGEFNYFRVCETANWTSGSVNCGNFELVGNSRDFISNYVKNLTTDDIVYYKNNYQTWVSYNMGQYCNLIEFCFSKDGVGALCFFADRSSQGSSRCGFDSPINQGNYIHYGLNNTLGLSSDTTFTSVSNAVIGDSPGISYVGGGEGGNIEADSSQVSDSQLTGNVVYATCSVHKALAWYKNKGYSANLCYAGTEYTGTGQDIPNEYFGGFVEPGYGLSIEDLWLDYGYLRAGGVEGSSMGYPDEFSLYWRNQYKLAMQNNNFSAFRNVPFAIQLWQENWDYFGGSFDNRSVIEFCHMVINELETAPYNGINKKTICNVNTVVEGYPEYNWVPQYGTGEGTGGSSGGGSSGGGSSNGGGGGVVVGSERGTMIGQNDWSPSGNSSNNYVNGSQFMNDVFNLFQAKYTAPKKSDFGGGILPDYIIVAFCGLLLFRFLARS